MTAVGALLKAFKDKISPSSAAFSGHRIIGDHPRQQIAPSLDLRVIFNGAGFDNRALQLKSGNLTKLNQTQIIESKPCAVVKFQFAQKSVYF